MSSSSPTLWPRESLITLKRSRSKSSTATPAPGSGSPSSRRTARAVASTKAHRLGRPVSESWRAWYASWASTADRANACPRMPAALRRVLVWPASKVHSRSTDSNPRNPMSWPWSDSGTASADCTPRDSNHSFSACHAASSATTDGMLTSSWRRSARTSGMSGVAMRPSRWRSASTPVATHSWVLIMSFDTGSNSTTSTRSTPASPPISASAMSTPASSWSTGRFTNAEARRTSRPSLTSRPRSWRSASVWLSTRRRVTIAAPNGATSGPAMPSTLIATQSPLANLTRRGWTGPVPDRGPQVSSRRAAITRSSGWMNSAMDRPRTAVGS